MGDQELACGMCLYKSIHQVKILRHTVKNHRFDANFVAYCQRPGCGASYTSWNSFKSHMHRKHRDVQLMLEDQAEDELDPEPNVIFNEGNQQGAPLPENQAQATTLTASERQTWNAVKFIQDLRESSNISQSATKKVIDGVQYLHETQLQLLKEEVLKGVDANGCVPIELIEESFEECSDLFAGVNTKGRVDRFLIDHGKLIMPQKIVLGTYWAWKYKPVAKIVSREHFFYNIPFVESLTQLLNQEDVMECINNPKIREDGYLKTYSDGYYANTHPIFSVDKRALMIIVYYDDVEIANPLGSKVKTHKLGMFYWTLGNIYPEHRSSLKAVNLLAIARTVLLRKYGIDKILQPFVEDMKRLESNGITISIHGNVQPIRGSLLFFTGDTLASNYVAGFKEGVSFATRPCRSCMGTKESIKSSFVETDFEMRNAQSHLDQCNIIDEPNLSSEARDFWSKTFGVNERSILLQLDTFDITKCMVQDLMHTGIEGLLDLEIRMLIKYCIEEKFATLADINKMIPNFDYGHLSKDIPTAIEPQHLDNKLRENAAQMMTLGNVLPFFLVEHIPPDDDRLCNFILLLQILNLMLAFKIKEDDVVQLKKMIEIHHTCFTTLYPNRPPTPKFHFFIHLPEQILRFGPLRQQWCMRFEAAHCRIKSLASVVKNFKNISYTLAYRYQSLRCAQLLTLPNEPSLKFVYSGHTVKSGITIYVRDYAYSNLIVDKLGITNPDHQVLLAKEISVNGTIYRKKSVILISDADDTLPSFGQVNDIIINGTAMLLVYKSLSTLSFSERLNAYNIHQYANAPVCTIAVGDLLHPHPLSIFNAIGQKYVILFHHRRIEVF